MAIETEIQDLKNKFEVLENKFNGIIEQQKQSQVEKLLTVKQVATMLKLTAQGVNYHIRKGTLKAIGKRCKKITEAEVLRYKKDNNC
ncbi:MAG: helix-turn-helix domain-containing protein [Bacteroidia bacterium]|nr:helix-turn-helix domain-containing protein [Bacteroidia bacterium]